MNKKYIYLRIDKKQWELWEERIKKDGECLIPFELLKAYRNIYLEKEEKRRENAKEANLYKRARADMKIFNTLETITNSLFRENSLKDLTISKLAKLSKVHYKTAERFWREYELDKWLDVIEKDRNKLKDFKYQMLAESLVYSRGK